MRLLSFLVVVVALVKDERLNPVTYISPRNLRLSTARLGSYNFPRF